MIKHDEAITRYYETRKASFGFIERIELVQSVDPRNWNGFILELDLRSEADALSSRLQLVFNGVQECRIGQMDGLLRYMLDITWIGDSQMEGRKYRITESEYDAIYFACESFDIVL